MKKTAVKSVYVCQDCGYESGKWLGRCPVCGQWHTLSEEKHVSSKKQSVQSGISAVQSAVCKLQDVEDVASERIITGIGELDRVLGGGLVAGSLVLIGGDPGVGKSTLALQAAALCAKTMKTLYVSGEESAAQVRLRLQRLAVVDGGLLFLAETVWENLLAQLEQHKPQLIIIDSIQTMMTAEFDGAAGSVAQIREVTARLLMLAKQNNIAIIIIGHVTKDGAIAGPRLLEHMVDVVLYVAGDRSQTLRIVRAHKNRFGSTAESGIFAMANEGMCEVANPSEFLIGQRPRNVAGSVVTTGMEGQRPILIEVQALVCETCYGMPRRTADGFDGNRLALLLAVLERRAGMLLGRYDVYVNVVGGIDISEPAADLAVALAVASAFSGRIVPEDLLVCGEIGLTGEVRAVARADERLREAIALGFRRIVLPAANLKNLNISEPQGFSFISAENIRQAIEVSLAN